MWMPYVGASYHLTPNKLTTIWKSEVPDEIKRRFFQAVVVYVLLYGCTTLTLTKRLEKRLDVKYRRICVSFLNRSRKQYTTNWPFLSSISKLFKSNEKHVRDTSMRDGLLGGMARESARLMMMKMLHSVQTIDGPLFLWCIYLPTPPHGQNFFLSPWLISITKLLSPFGPTIYSLLRGGERIVGFIRFPNFKGERFIFNPRPENLSFIPIWNANSLVQDLNYCCRIHFLQW